MAVDIPIHGEELLIINWKEADKNRTKLKGKFGTRIFTSAKNHPDAKKYLPLLKTFIKGWSQIIFLNNQLANSGIENYCKGQSCKLGSSHWTWSFKDGHLYIDYKISKMSSLRFDFSDFVDGAPRRVSVSPPGQVTQNAPFQLDLFLSACE
ncbi:hypothetical protein A9Q84_07155 [Halobacteriovorax marinus]|uniref:Uncharacterized protein n=1 Tax=Halobacteriovorax marinus TaxID=97084 RepID=A0A1Y5FBX6_9BACT|nr:hypothetical protein A9Q84_07155 [Halobacteriovorax marinus]